MAVFRSELNWSTYQDKQLRTLESIDKSLFSSLQISTRIRNDLQNNEGFMRQATQAFSTMTVILDSIEHSMTAISYDLIKDFIPTMRSFDDIVRDAGVTVRDSSSNLEGSFRELEERVREEHEEIGRRTARRRREEEEERRVRNEKLASFSETVDTLMTKFNTLGQTAERFSELSNYLIKFSGATGDTVSNFRESVVQDITQEMNRDIGSAYFNSQEVYQQMVSIANASGIGDLDVLKEITRPIMLANESMDVNIGELSTLLGRWNSRYNFSSIAMEDLVDQIRGNTAGNMASAEKTVQNLASLDNMIAVYAGGDQDKMLQMADAISEGTARLESMGIDTSRYTEYLKDIATGDFNTNTMLLSVLNQAGISNSQASKLFANGNIDELYEALYQGELSLAKSLGIDKLASGETVPFSQAAKAHGVDPSNLFDVVASSYNATSLQEFEESVADTATAVESIEDKWISWSDRVENWLSKFYEKLASIQEKFGISLTDIAAGWYLAKGVVSSGGLLTKIGSAIGVGGATGAGGSASLLGSLGAIAPALGIGAAAVGLIASVGSIVATLSQLKDIEAETFANTFGDDKFIEGVKSGEKVVYEKNYTEDAKGNLIEEWSQKLISQEEYDKDPDKWQSAEKEYLSSTLLDQGNYKWYNGIADIALGILGTAGVMVGDVVGAKYSNGILGDMYKGAEGWMNSATEYWYNKDKKQELGNINSLSNLTDEQWAVYDDYRNANMKAVGDSESLAEFFSNIDTYVSKYKEGKVKVGGNWVDISDVGAFGTAGYATGSNYIEQDQLAYLHEGEAVVPKRYNPAANLTELELLRKQSQESRRENTREEDETQRYLKEVSDTMKDIKSFLNEWKRSNDQSELLSNTRSKFNSRLTAITTY